MSSEPGIATCSAATSIEERPAMNLRATMFLLLAGTCLMGPALLSTGTKPPNAERVVWRQSNKATIDAHQIRIEGAQTPIALPPDTLWASWRPDGIYALASIAATDKIPSHLEVLCRLEGSTAWESYAVLPKGL